MVLGGTWSGILGVAGLFPSGPSLVDNGDGDASIRAYHGAGRAPVWKGR